MKKVLILVVVALITTCYGRAAMYIVGNDPFGGWNPDCGVEMLDRGNGLYSYTAVINGSVWFVFADGLSSDWTTFNNDYCYGPTDGDETVTSNSWIQTQKVGGKGAYKLTGHGDEFEFTFDKINCRFAVNWWSVDPPPGFIVVGEPASLFGTEWDPNNKDNLMTQDGEGLFVWARTSVLLYEGSFSFKIVRQGYGWDYAWPEYNYEVLVPVSGLYDVTITYNLDTDEINCYPVLVQQVDPYETSDVYILGEVNFIGWWPDRGLRMYYDSDNKVYSARFTAKGQYLQEEPLAYFGFTGKLASADDTWDEIVDDRFGPLCDGYFVVSEDDLGKDFPLNPNGGSDPIGVPEGTWTLKVDLANKTFNITGEAHPVDVSVFTVLGPHSVFGSEWDPVDTTNDMTYRNGVYVWKKENVILQAPGFDLKVVGNHDRDFFEWPLGTGNNYHVSVPHNGLYSVTITFNFVPFGNHLVACEIKENEVSDIPGDVNGDGEVNIGDINSIIDAIFSNDSAARFDVNGDQEVNLGDISCVVNIILTAM